MRETRQQVRTHRASCAEAPEPTPNAVEVTDRILASIERHLVFDGCSGRLVLYHPSGSSRHLESHAAREWMRAEVDAGRRTVAWHVESRLLGTVIVGLDAFEGLGGRSGERRQKSVEETGPAERARESRRTRATH